jgi:hypothetical protein
MLPQTNLALDCGTYLRPFQQIFKSFGKALGKKTSTRKGDCQVESRTDRAWVSQRLDPRNLVVVYFIEPLNHGSHNWVQLHMARFCQGQQDLFSFREARGIPLRGHNDGPAIGRWG